MVRCLFCAFLACLALLTCTPTVRFSDGPSKGYSQGAPDFVVIDRERIMNSVKKFEGIPYKWGGEKNDGMDCSGLVRSVFKDCANIDLPHSSGEQTKYGVEIPMQNLTCGDLVFFKISGFSVDHVGIYLGEGQFVHASKNTGVTVTQMDDPYYKERFAFAKRLYYE